MTNRPILIGPRIWEQLDSYDKNLKSKFIRAFRFLSMDMSHPSLQVELIRVGNDRFYRARVDPNYRIHFDRREDCHLILAVGPHHIQGIG
jgi:mRNA-degrading endonuclease RelE of RelBE toxin-antitoxin system